MGNWAALGNACTWGILRVILKRYNEFDVMTFGYDVMSAIPIAL